MDSADSATARRIPLLTLGICAGVLILFAVLSYSASETKSAVFDEPLHLVGGYVRRTSGDFRMNPEDPALFGYIASLPQPAGSIKVDYDWPRWPQLLDDFNRHQWTFATITLFQTPGNDAERIVQRSRFLLMLFGVILGGTIAWWSWRLAGASAALIAVTLFGLDPNFMVHASLVKNDVLLSLLILLLAISLWKFGQRGTWRSMSAIALITALAVNIKFSGLLFGPIIFVVLISRALLPQPWIVAGKTLTARWQKFLVVPAACGLVAIVSFMAIWACYGFRFAPTHNPSALLNTPTEAELTRKYYLISRGVDVSNHTSEMINQQFVPLVDGIVWAESIHLLPPAENASPT